MKKFELTGEFITFLGKKLFRIKALVGFGDVKAGKLGGYVEKEENLDHEGNAWVYGNARVEKQEDIIFTAAKFGTIFRTTTAYRTTDGIRINCGCFSGNLEEFREQIIQTRDGRMRKKYLHHADEIEMYFDLDLEKEEKEWW